MSRFLIEVAALAASCWLSVGTALAENRIALIIGNSNYSTVTALPNPANDARAMTKFLTSAGFQVVQEPDLTQSDMRRAISNFASMVAAKGPDTVAVVFYAGHGVQVNGENYLIPIDARIEREADVPLQAMRLGDVMNALSGVPSKSRIVILDACRNNPFSAINKTGGRGLAIVNAPNGSLVSYSTAPGTEALDGDDQNSPYTTALLKYGAEPGAPIEQVLKRVRQSVSEATARKQFPWESSSLISEFSFFPTASGQEQPTPTLAKAGPASTLAKGGPASALAKAGPGSAALVSGSEARSVEHWRKELRSKNPREAYEIVVGEDRVEAYQAYLSLYPNQSLAPVVRTVLERRQVVVAWYQAVTINTPAAYQAFLASHGGSDYAVTADRLLQRALTRSAANAGAAFAATCPCTPAREPAAAAPEALRSGQYVAEPEHPGQSDEPGANQRHRVQPAAGGLYRSRPADRGRAARLYSAAGSGRAAVPAARLWRQALSAARRRQTLSSARRRQAETADRRQAETAGGRHQAAADRGRPQAGTRSGSEYSSSRHAVHRYVAGEAAGHLPGRKPQKTTSDYNPLQSHAALPRLRA